VRRIRAALALVGCAGCGGPARDPAVGADGVAGGESVAVVRDCAPARGDASRVARVEEDVPYAAGDDDVRRLDIALPPGGGAAPRPLVVLLHGGSWSGGSRRNLRDEMLALAARGYVAASLGYRLTQAPRNVFPAALQDVRCAVRWLRSHAERYGIDTARVAAVGYSAGGHLASMLGVAPPDEALDGRCAAQSRSPAVSAVISYAGPQDLRVNGPYTAEQARLVTNFLGAFPGDAPRMAALASPIAHVRTGAPPFLLVQGSVDDLVPPDHARRMAAELRGVGTAATVLELRGVGHEFVGLATSGRAEVRCTTLAFLDRWLRAR